MTAAKPPATPPARTTTVRDAIAAELRQAPLTAREVSERVRISEREVLAHLEHLARSGRGRGEHLTIEPARCLGCGFVFEGRDRVTRPGRCPACRETRVSAPRFSLAGGD